MPEIPGDTREKSGGADDAAGKAAAAKRPAKA